MTESLIEKEYPDRDFYAELVGPNQKFKDEKELAKGKWYADELVRTYEHRMDQMREEIDSLRSKEQASAKLTDLIDQYQNRQQVPPENTTLLQDKSPSIDVKQIESLIDSRMQDRETSRKQQDNYTFVKNKLVEQYGPNYSTALSKQMAELDMSESYLNDMAKNSPKALLKMLGIEENPVLRDPFRAPPRSNMIQNQYTPQQEERTWAWYQKLKEENPKKYYSRETNVQMHNDAVRLGERFEDGDFNRYAKDYRISY